MSAVPRDVVEAKMKVFEDAYNADDAETCASLYSDPCHVTVNGGVENGGPFTGTTPAEVAGFLRNLRNAMGGTNIKFTVTKVADAVHEDTWTADNGTGSCKGVWEKRGDDWVITKDEITFTPKQEESA